MPHAHPQAEPQRQVQTFHPNTTQPLQQDSDRQELSTERIQLSCDFSGLALPDDDVVRPATEDRSDGDTGYVVQARTQRPSHASERNDALMRHQSSMFPQPVTVGRSLALANAMGPPPSIPLGQASSISAVQVWRNANLEPRPPIDAAEFNALLRSTARWRGGHIGVLQLERELVVEQGRGLPMLWYDGTPSSIPCTSTMRGLVLLLDSHLRVVETEIPQLHEPAHVSGERLGHIIAHVRPALIMALDLKIRLLLANVHPRHPMVQGLRKLRRDLAAVQDAYHNKRAETCLSLVLAGATAPIPRQQNPIITPNARHDLLTTRLGLVEGRELTPELISCLPRAVPVAAAYNYGQLYRQITGPPLRVDSRSLLRTAVQHAILQYLHVHHERTWLGPPVESIRAAGNDARAAPSTPPRQLVGLGRDMNSLADGRRLYSMEAMRDMNPLGQTAALASSGAGSVSARIQLPDSDISASI